MQFFQSRFIHTLINENVGPLESFYGLGQHSFLSEFPLREEGRTKKGRKIRLTYFSKCRSFVPVCSDSYFRFAVSQYGYGWK